MEKSIVFENSFDDENYIDVMTNPAYLVFHSQVFKKFKPIRGRRGVRWRHDGTYRTFPLGRGAYRLWDSSRGLKKIMKIEKEEDWNNCLSIEILQSDSDNYMNVYKSANNALLKQIILRNINKIDINRDIIN